MVKMGQSRKLNPLFTGPYLVVKVLSPYLYRVRDRKKTLVLHHDRLKICEEQAVPFWVRRRRHDLFRRLDNEDQTSQVVATSQASVAEPQEAMLESRDLEETLPYSVTEEAATGNQEADLDATLPYGTDQVPMSSTQDGPVADLEVTLPYGIEVLEEEQQDTPSEDFQKSKYLRSTDGCRRMSGVCQVSLRSRSAREVVGYCARLPI